MVRLNPDRAIEFVYRAQERAKRDDVSGALADLTEAIRIGPGDRLAVCLRNRARLLTQLGRAAEAADDWRRALDADPADAVARAELGRLRSS